jgi:hypothetical protein
MYMTSFHLPYGHFAVSRLEAGSHMRDASLDAVNAVFLDPLVIVAKMLRCDGDDLKDP